MFSAGPDDGGTWFPPVTDWRQRNVPTKNNSLEPASVPRFYTILTPKG
jgi:hypothetical protein